LNEASQSLKVNFILQTGVTAIKSSGALRLVNYSLTQKLKALVSPETPAVIHQTHRTLHRLQEQC